MIVVDDIRIGKARADEVIYPLAPTLATVVFPLFGLFINFRQTPTAYLADEIAATGVNRLIVPNGQNLRSTHFSPNQFVAQSYVIATDR